MIVTLSMDSFRMNPGQNPTLTKPHRTKPHPTGQNPTLTKPHRTKPHPTGQNPTGQNPTLTKPHQLFSVKDKTPLFSCSRIDNINDHHNFIFKYIYTHYIHITQVTVYFMFILYILIYLYKNNIYLIVNLIQNVYSAVFRMYLIV